MLLLALQHDRQMSDRIGELLHLSDRDLAQLTRGLLESLDNDTSPEARELGMTQAEFDAAIQAGIDDMEAGRVMDAHEFDQKMRAKYSFL